MTTTLSLSNALIYSITISKPTALYSITFIEVLRLKLAFVIVIVLFLLPLDMDINTIYSLMVGCSSSPIMVVRINQWQGLGEHLCTSYSSSS
jgi:hypothetical protein